MTLIAKADARTVPIVPLEKAKLAAWAKRQSATTREWIAATNQCSWCSRTVTQHRSQRATSSWRPT